MQSRSSKCLQSVAQTFLSVLLGCTRSSRTGRANVGRRSTSARARQECPAHPIVGAYLKIVGLVAVLLLLASVCLAQDKITYDDHVKPIFTNNCASCHNPDKNKAG